MALIVEKYVGKGSKIAIEGKLKQHKYETEDGEKRSYTEIVANEVLLMDAKNNTTTTEK